MAHAEHGFGHAFNEWFMKYIAEFEPTLGLDPTAAESFTDWLGEFGVSRGIVLSLFFAGFLSILSLLIPNLPIFALGWLAGTAPLWLPCALYWAAWKAWVNYVRSNHLAGIKGIVLEVKVPREITKSPRAMELVFTNLYHSSGEVSYIDRAWNGKVRTWYSFEIASFGGEIHFYVWCNANYRRLVETSIYAQYPDVEIVEVEDYISKFRFDPHKHGCRVGDYRLMKGDETPIRTYVDFELDKDPKEEHLVDPLASFFETLSNLKPTEQVWIQMLFRVDAKNGIIVRTPSGWKERVEAKVDEIRQKMIYQKDPADKGFPRPTWAQNELMRAMERQLTKTAYDVGMRFAYISETGMDGVAFTAVRWIYKIYNWANFAQILRSGRGHDPFDYPWQDWHEFRYNLVTRRHLDAMRRRSYFYQPWITPSYVMSTEVLASLYHYPHTAIKAPGLQRIQATKSEPPPNLPR